MSVLFSESVMQAVAEILAKHHRAVAAAIYGKEALAQADWDLAVKLGLVNASATGETLNSQVYRFGMLLAHMDQAERQSRYGDSPAKWLEEIERNPLPMTTTEASAAKYASHKAAQYVVGLGRRASATIGTSLINEDARLSSEFRESIRDAVAANFGDDDAQQRLAARGVKQGLPDDFFENAFRGSTKRLRSDLGHLTQQWARDLERIARTETTEAWNQGQVDEWDRMSLETAEATEKPPVEPLVYRVPSPTACSDCLRLYTASPSGGPIRIFRLSDLQGNGTNYKLKRADWKPIVGATHPYCVCDIQSLPTYVRMPVGWVSGQPAPSVIDDDGFLVLPEVE